jgi:hypothetical protein
MSDYARVRNYMVRAYVVKVKEAYVAGAGCSGYMRLWGNYEFQITNGERFPFVIVPVGDGTFVDPDVSPRFAVV